MTKKSCLYICEGRFADIEVICLITKIKVSSISIESLGQEQIVSKHSKAQPIIAWTVWCRKVLCVLSRTLNVARNMWNSASHLQRTICFWPILKNMCFLTRLVDVSNCPSILFPRHEATKAHENGCGELLCWRFLEFVEELRSRYMSP